MGVNYDDRPDRQKNDKASAQRSKNPQGLPRVVTGLGLVLGARLGGAIADSRLSAPRLMSSRPLR